MDPSAEDPPLVEILITTRLDQRPRYYAPFLVSLDERLKLIGWNDPGIGGVLRIGNSAFETKESDEMIRRARKTDVVGRPVISLLQALHVESPHAAVRSFDHDIHGLLVAQVSDASMPSR